jgi:hypothetical protein
LTINLIEYIIIIKDYHRRPQMEQEKELITLFRKMDRETRDLFLSHGRIAIVAEESVKKSLLKGQPPRYADRNPTPMEEAAI